MTLTEKCYFRKHNKKSCLNDTSKTCWIMKPAEISCFLQWQENPVFMTKPKNPLFDTNWKILFLKTIRKLLFQLSKSDFGDLMLIFTNAQAVWACKIRLPDNQFLLIQPLWITLGNWKLNWTSLSNFDSKADYFLVVCGSDFTMEDLALDSDKADEICNIVKSSFLDDEFDSRYIPVNIQLVNSELLSSQYEGMFYVILQLNLSELSFLLYLFMFDWTCWKARYLGLYWQLLVV